jgi:hypothetical protein
LSRHQRVSDEVTTGKMIFIPGHACPPGDKEGGCRYTLFVNNRTRSARNGILM